MFEIKPIFNALCRSKVGAVLLLIQIAITTAIVNAAFIIQDRIGYLSQQTGYPEEDIFVFHVMMFGQDVYCLNSMNSMKPCFAKYRVVDAAYS